MLEWLSNHLTRHSPADNSLAAPLTAFAPASPLPHTPGYQSTGQFFHRAPGSDSWSASTPRGSKCCSNKSCRLLGLASCRELHKFKSAEDNGFSAYIPHRLCKITPTAAADSSELCTGRPRAKKSEKQSTDTEDDR